MVKCQIEHPLAATHTSNTDVPGGGGVALFVSVRNCAKACTVPSAHIARDGTGHSIVYLKAKGNNALPNHLFSVKRSEAVKRKNRKKPTWIWLISPQTTSLHIDSISISSRPSDFLEEALLSPAQGTSRIVWRSRI